jgi:hypothetical protein
MRSRGIWLTVLMRGCKLNSLTPPNGGTTAPISYTQCYVLGVGMTTNKQRRIGFPTSANVGGLSSILAHTYT